MRKRKLKNYNDLQNRTLPWWRLGPCVLAVAALAFVPGWSPSIDQDTDAKLPVTTVAYQDQNEAPTIQLPDEISFGDESDVLSPEAIEKKLRGSMSKEHLDAGNLAAANKLVDSIAPGDWAEWLGPLAPIALSPFFGITCLSGLAIWGPEWMPGHSLLDSATPLKNPTLFWAFLALTVATSLPRLSKVSKPIAQACDKLEAYAGIITLIAIRYIAVPSEVAVDSPEMVQAGIVGSSIGALLYVAMVINVLVINSVKFFFEFLIWLTPIPFLDACFEAANKSVCAALIALYAYSPTLATMLNLAVFAVCLLALRWINRRITFYRGMAIDSIVPMISSNYGKPTMPEIIVFPKTDWNGFQDMAKLVLIREDDQLKVKQHRWFRHPVEKHLAEGTALEIKKGWITNTLTVSGDQPVEMTFSRRYQSDLEEVARLIGAKLETAGEEASEVLKKTEFA